MTDLTNKQVLITGATSGIGKVTALELAKMNAHVVIVGRNPAKTAATVHEIQAQSGNPVVEMLLADLSSMQEVRQLTQQFKDRYAKLDILINNAGVIMTSRQETVDGYEMTFAVNHLAYFLLTNLLLDVLQASTPARIINVASEIHPRGTINFADLHNQASYQFLDVYAQSKLANILFTYELARRLEDSHITVNAVDPGAVATHLGRNNGLFWKAVAYGLALFLSTPEEGAETAIHLASSPTVEGVTGQYFRDCQPIKSSPESYDQRVAQRLWDASVQLAGLVTV